MKEKNNGKGHFGNIKRKKIMKKKIEGIRGNLKERNKEK